MRAPERKVVFVTIRAHRVLGDIELTDIERKLADALGGTQYTVQLLDADGGRRYIGSRPNKRQRLDAVEQHQNLTPEACADMLGLSVRQVYRYRALLSAIMTHTPDGAAS